MRRVPPVSRRAFVLLCAVSIAFRIVLALTTYGSNDVQFTSVWAALVEEVGITDAYSFAPQLNHPPLSLAIMLSFRSIARVTHLGFPSVFRLFQVLADCLCAFALYRIGRVQSEQLGRALALFVLLSPASAFLSGFHCNTDPTMIALTVLAASFLLVDEPSPALAGLTLAAATSIKIIPFLLVPAFFFSTPPKSRLKFALVFLGAVIVLFGPTILFGGPDVVKNIFGYAGGAPYEWGFSGVAFAISRNFPPLREAAEHAMGWVGRYGRYVVYAAIAASILFTVIRRPPLLRGAAITILAVLAFAPGFGVQYLAWILPLLPFAFRWRWAIAINAAASIFLFITYTVWSGGLPWWFADIARPGPYRYMPAVAGYAMWVIVCAALVASVRSRGVTETAAAAV